MTKENILFSIIGVLLGFIVGFIFTNSVNQRSVAPRVATSAVAAGGESNTNLPPDHPTLPMNAVKDQQALETVAGELSRRAREANDDFDAQLKASEASYQAGRTDEALSFLQRANELKPDDYQVLVTLGNVNYDAGRYETAGRWYSEALIKKPDDISVRTDLGLTYFLRQPPDIERALNEFRRSLELDPQHEQTLQNAVVVLTRKGDVREAETMLARLEKVNPSNETLARLREEIESARNAPTTDAATPVSSNSNGNREK
ncbi:MAG TPA: tetratricopeptide repeat protein [Pyrinomonadaceae bacterium]|jgi:Flp pilus assembly protein TadD